MGNKFVLIVPYFGKWPDYLPLFLFSVSHNPFIDVLFYTDCGLPESYPSNVIFKEITFEQYCCNVSRALGLHFHPCKAYKLCDLKPFYGSIHAEDIGSYEFWGFGDIDVVWGDMSILKRISKDKDLITFYASQIAGPLTFIRLKSKYTKRAYKIYKWREKLMDDKNLWIDETDFSTITLPHIRLLKFALYHIVLPPPGWYKQCFIFDKFSQIWSRLFPYHKVYAREAFSTLGKEFRYVYDTTCGTLECSMIDEQDFPMRSKFIKHKDRLGSMFVHFYMLKKSNLDWTCPTLSYDEIDTYKKIEISIDGIRPIM